MASAILSLSSATAFTSRPFLDNLKQANMKLGTPNQSTLFGKDYIRAKLGNDLMLVIVADGQSFEYVLYLNKSFTRKSVTSAVEVSRFGDITMAPPDPILGVSEAFRADTHEMKLNLGVGAYRTEDLQPYVLNVVKKAENLMLERGENKEYLPIEGLAAFNKVTAELLLGAQNDVIQQQRVATVQGLSGTGSLRLAAALIERYFSGSKVLISSPTWGNHKNIFNDARVPWSEYRYYDPRTVGLDFHGMISDIKAAPEGSFVLLHGCAHNPTGIDPTPEQWESIADVIQEKNHIPFFDVAYQGFASGSLDTDASSVRLFAARGMEFLVAQSYSKNLGLYAERIGAINVVCSSSDIAKRVKSQLKRLARPMYSNPPIHGARIVANVVGNPELFNDWKEEMELMAGRIKSVRKKLYDSLSAKDNSGKDWSFVLKQIGMFSFTGLNDAQSENMTNKWHVYMTKDGRISLAGLSSAKCEYLADAIIDSYYNIS
ncbi:UNVERIFIED_CONTAM: Aspartate aminotransferase, chloroplastic [Sesamum indicum]